ncbi:hypothetical protein PGT21_018656 [Puccinia graminis f. sp. tritici]|uniref:Uncharacterized protein n=1 Tax=Puccinia graminis f. sp. tritici TaxID=56615 RepID=A0A5B0M0H5_PUCGR|nr:hypothetical protein PGT21_018656 [Puccinia graminis f. sp. tritici]
MAQPRNQGYLIGNPQRVVILASASLLAQPLIYPYTSQQPQGSDNAHLLAKPVTTGQQYASPWQTPLKTTFTVQDDNLTYLVHLPPAGLVDNVTPRHHKKPKIRPGLLFKSASTSPSNSVQLETYLFCTI